MRSSENPKTQQNQVLLSTCKRHLLESLASSVKPFTSDKQVNRVSFAEADNEQSNSITDEKIADAQSFTVLNVDKVRSMCKDKEWRTSVVVLCRCTCDFLSPACYWNKHWKLNRDDLVSLMEFAFLMLKVFLFTTST